MCSCTKRLELWCGLSQSRILDEDLDNIESNIAIGCCPHVSQALNDTSLRVKSDFLSNETIGHGSINHTTMTKIEHMIRELNNGSKRWDMNSDQSSNCLKHTSDVKLYCKFAGIPMSSILTAMGKFEIVKSLVYMSSVAMGCSIGTFQKSNIIELSPIHVAIEHNNIEMLKFFLTIHGDRLIRDLETSTAGRFSYLFALKRDNMAAFKLLLKRHKQLRRREEYHVTLQSALAFAFAEKKDVAIIKYLLKKGATLQKMDTTLLHMSPFVTLFAREVIEEVVSAGNITAFVLSIQAGLVDMDLNYTLARIVFHGMSFA